MNHAWTLLNITSLFKLKFRTILKTTKKVLYIWARKIKSTPLHQWASLLAIIKVHIMKDELIKTPLRQYVCFVVGGKHAWETLDGMDLKGMHKVPQSGAQQLIPVLNTYRHPEQILHS